MSLVSSRSYTSESRFSFVSRLPSMTVQSGKDDADINVLVRRFGLDGPFPQNIRPPLPDGFYEVTDYRQAQNQIRLADEAFAALPAHVRSRFQNDPALFTDFCTDVDVDGKLLNLEEMRKIGLAVPAQPGDNTPDSIIPVPVP